MILTLVTQDDLIDLKQAYREKLNINKATCPSLHNLLSDLTNNPGSLIRAQLCHSSMTARGSNKDKILNLSISLEYFHTASLIFDDLPCMDNALDRRGQPCLHKVYGEATAILGALALINRGYALFWEVIGDLPADRRKKCSDLVELCLGLKGIVSGQSLDIAYNPTTSSKQSVTSIADKKTGSLFLLSILLPALVTGIEKKETRNLQKLSLLFGRAYQLLDDQKDLSLNKNLSGKTARDEELNRPNMFIKMGDSYTDTYFKRLLMLIEKKLLKLEKISTGLNTYHALLKHLKVSSESMQKPLSINVCN